MSFVWRPLSRIGGHVVGVKGGHILKPQRCVFLVNSVRRGHSASNGPENDGTKMLEERQMSVPSFGGHLLCRSNIDVSVTPMGAHEYHNMDRAIVRLFGEDKTGVEFEVKQNGNEMTIEAKRKDKDQKGRQEIQVPMVHNVSIDATGGASIEVSDLIESDFCNIAGTSGDITVSAVKTRNLNIQNESGDVVLNGHIQGEVNIRTEGGNVVGDKKFSGPSVDIATNSGDIRCASSYSDQAKFSTNTGSMNLRNLHNESYIAVYESGDVSVQSLDGCANIFVKKGDVDCHMSRVSAESRIHVEDGDVRLRINEAHPIKISIDANDIIPDAKLRNLGVMEVLAKEGMTKHFSCAIHPDKFSPNVLVIAENGRVILECQDWAASLGLKMPMPTGINSQ